MIIHSYYSKYLLLSFLISFLLYIGLILVTDTINGEFVCWQIFTIFSFFSSLYLGLKLKVKELFLLIFSYQIRRGIARGRDHQTGLAQHGRQEVKNAGRNCAVRRKNDAARHDGGGQRGKQPPPAASGRLYRAGKGQAEPENLLGSCQAARRTDGPHPALRPAGPWQDHTGRHHCQRNGRTDPYYQRPGH